MVFYRVFKSLGLKTDILPVLDLSALDDMSDEVDYEREEEFYSSSPWPYWEDYGRPEDGLPECNSCYLEFPNFEEWKATRPRINQIGTTLHGLKISKSDGKADDVREIKEMILQEAWPWKKYTDIQWLNATEKLSNGNGWQLSILHHIGYKDCIEVFYSRLVILITVPKMADRNLMVTK